MLSSLGLYLIFVLYLSLMQSIIPHHEGKDTQHYYSVHSIQTTNKMLFPTKIAKFKCKTTKLI